MSIKTQDTTFVLASSSPRRRELLGLTDLSFDIVAADVDETPLPDEVARAYVARVAKSKANAAASLVQNGEVVIAADTIVIFEDEILGKPKDAQDAFDTLERLRNKNHQVVTNLVVLETGENILISETAFTDVPMRDYSDEEVQAYIASGDPFDKAGSYAIQHSGFHPVEHLAGCYANVVGMPLCHLVRATEKIAGENMADIPDRCQNHFNYDCPVYEKVLKGDL